MTRGLEQKSAFPALRVRNDGSATAEIFMASSLGITYKDLPVCMLADGESIVAEIGAGEILGILGPPTHYYAASTDQCWPLDPEEFARFKAQSSPARLFLSGGPSSNGGWVAPAPRVFRSGENQGYPRASQGGGGMLTTHMKLW